MKEHIYYNPNPKYNRVGDCTVRALCKATGESWDYVHTALCAISNADGNMPSANVVWGKFLKMNGFRRHMIEENGKERYTVRDFCEDNPEGTYILAIDGHVVCVVDGNYYDTWDSGDEEPIFYWVRENES